MKDTFQGLIAIFLVLVVILLSYYVSFALAALLFVGGAVLVIVFVLAMLVDWVKTELFGLDDDDTTSK